MANITIGGATAKAWVDSGALAGIAVTLSADPAGDAPHTYTYSDGADPVFDALDHDGLINGPAEFGIGVNNTTIVSGNPGVTSTPSEIGYYGQTPLNYFPDGDRVRAS